MNIAGREIDLEHPPYIIAELGVNHDGSIEQALALTKLARETGADAIKLQYFETDRLLSSASRLAAYQEQSGALDPFEMLRRLEMDIESMKRIVNHARTLGLHVIVTLFSLETVEQATTIEWDAFKTASPDIINQPLIERLKKTGKPLILSSGASTLEEIARAVSWMGHHPHVFMQCVSAYPTQERDAALGGRLAMLEATPNALGYSDHTMAEDTGALAVASGACMLEKHLTHDRSAPGPDHASSLDPDGFTRYVQLAHRAARMRGPIEKCVLQVEEDVRNVSRQSLIATRDLPRGHTLTPEDVTVKRPGSGLAPFELDRVIGNTLARAIEADMPIKAEHLS